VSTDRISLSHLRHELHTPLNHIIGYSELLLESAAEQDMTALEPGLRELHQHARQLLLLVDDVLGRTRKDGDIDLGRLSSLTSAPISSLIAAADELKVRAQQAGPAGVDQDLEHIAGAARTLRSMIAGGASWRLPEATPSGADTARLPVAPLPAAETGSILVVDDNAENREMLSRRLARAGHRVPRPHDIGAR
jgi:hypothetical protein